MPTATPSIPIENRVADLLAQMTLEEKLAQLGSCWIYELANEGEAARLLQHGIGQITRIGGASNLTPAESAAAANRIQKFLLEETPLGIPGMVHEECCAGYMARDATVFPQIIGLASTWQPELATQMAGVANPPLPSSIRQSSAGWPGALPGSLWSCSRIKIPCCPCQKP